MRKNRQPSIHAYQRCTNHCPGQEFFAYQREEHYVFPISYSDYLSTVKETAAFFQLSARITTHSARIGGSIHDFISGVSAETFASIESWSSLSSLQHYLQNGRSWVMTIPMGERSHVRFNRHSTKAIQTFKQCQNIINPSHK